MTKHLEDVLNLPHLEDLIKAEQNANDSSDDTDEKNEEIIKNISLMSAIDMEVSKLNDSDHEESMDKLHDEMLAHSRELMDLGFNIDIRSARGIFEVAASMYKNVLDAKNSKRDAQLKTLKIELDARKLKIAEALSKNEGFGDIENAETVIIEDRNEIIRALRDKAKP